MRRVTDIRIVRATEVAELEDGIRALLPEYQPRGEIAVVVDPKESTPHFQQVMVKYEH